MGIRFPNLKFQRRPKRVSYYFYKSLTRKWNRSPTVTIYGLDGTTANIYYHRGRLSVESETDIFTTDEIRIKEPEELFSGFNNFLGDGYRAGIIRGPVNGGPVYLEMQHRWTITDDVCRSFLEDVWYALTGQKISFQI